MPTERLAIAGSHGFIGKRMFSRLEQQGYDVVRLGRDGNVPSEIDIIFDLASYGNMYHHKDEMEMFRANVLRPVTILRRKSPNTKYVYVSTSSVMLPVQTPYSESKMQAESMMDIVWPQAIIVRPYSVTGPGEQESHLIPKLINSCLTGEKMPFVPHPVHDFIDVDDFVEALWIISQKGAGGIYNVGTGKQYSNNEVRMIVEKVTGKKANVEIVQSMRRYDTDAWVADPVRVEGLGWKPKYTLEDSVRRMYEGITQKNT